MVVRAAVGRGQLLLEAETHHQLHQAKVITVAQVLVRRVLQQVVAVVEQVQQDKMLERLVRLKAVLAVLVQHLQFQGHPLHIQAAVVVVVIQPILLPVAPVVAVMVVQPVEPVQMVYLTPGVVEVALAGLVDLLPVQVGQALSSLNTTHHCNPHLSTVVLASG